MDARSLLRAELQQKRPSPHVIKKLLKQELNGKIPSSMRLDIWQVLLGVESKDRFLLDDSIRDTIEDMENQRVIRVDAGRTRADMPDFRSPEMQQLISKLLTFYCKSKEIRYKQGLNEVLAPFIMLRRDPPVPDGTVYNLFYSFIERYLPHLYVTEEFNSLQCSFSLLRLALQYHDPELSGMLDANSIAPELYATPWILTLLARNVKLEVLFVLWDTYLLSDGDHGFQSHMFVILALLISNRAVLLNSDPSDLPIVLCNLINNSSTVDVLETVSGFSEETLLKIVDLGNHLEKITPDSFKIALSRYVLHQCPSERTLESLQVQPSLYMTCRQTIDLLTNKLGERNETFILQLVDCRSKHLVELQHIIGSIHLNPDLQDHPDPLQAALDKLKTLGGDESSSVKIHIVLIGESSPGSSKYSSIPNIVSRDSILFCYHLIQRGMKRVSILEGGWDKFKATSKGTKEEELLFESGDCMDALFEIVPVKSPRSSTFDTIKDTLAVAKAKFRFPDEEAGKKPVMASLSSTWNNWVHSSDIFDLEDWVSKHPSGSLTYFNADRVIKLSEDSTTMQECILVISPVDITVLQVMATHANRVKVLDKFVLKDLVKVSTPHSQSYL